MQLTLHILCKIGQVIVCFVRRGLRGSDSYEVLALILLPDGFVVGSHLGPLQPKGIPCILNASLGVVTTSLETICNRVSYSGSNFLGNSICSRLDLLRSSLDGGAPALLTSFVCHLNFDAKEQLQAIVCVYVCVYVSRVGVIPVLPPFYSWRGLQIHSSYSSPVIRSLPVVSNITEAQVVTPRASTGGEFRRYLFGCLVHGHQIEPRGCRFRVITLARRSLVRLI